MDSETCQNNHGCMKVIDFENASTKEKEHSHVCVDVVTQCQAKPGEKLTIKGLD
jgi:hypothetical protein